MGAQQARISPSFLASRLLHTTQFPLSGLCTPPLINSYLSFNVQFKHQHLGQSLPQFCESKVKAMFL